MDLLKPFRGQKPWKNKEKGVLVNPFPRFTKTTDSLLKFAILRAGVHKWLPIFPGKLRLRKNHGNFPAIFQFRIPMQTVNPCFFGWKEISLASFKQGILWVSRPWVSSLLFFFPAVSGFCQERKSLLLSGFWLVRQKLSIIVWITTSLKTKLLVNR